MTKKLFDFIDEYLDVIDTVTEMSKTQDDPFICLDVEGVNFDKLTKQYIVKWFSKAYPKSNDSVIHHEGMDYFVEFKSGENIAKKDIYGKIRDSLLT